MDERDERDRRSARRSDDRRRQSYRAPSDRYSNRDGRDEARRSSRYDDRRTPRTTNRASGRNGETPRDTRSASTGRRNDRTRYDRYDRTRTSSPRTDGARSSARSSQTGQRRTSSPKGNQAYSTIADSGFLSSIPRNRLIAGVAIAISVIIILAFFIRPPATTTGDSAGSAQPQGPTETVDFELTPASLDAVPSDTGLTTFSLSTLKVPSISDWKLGNIRSAIAAIHDPRDADIGVIFFDVQTGRGISYNADKRIYGGSSFEGPYALYICEKLVDKGTVTLDKQVEISEIQAYTDMAEGIYTTKELVSATIRKSDTNAFAALRGAYDGGGFNAWVKELGASDCESSETTYFPTYSTRSSARLWSQMRNYLATGNETSQWLATELENSDISWIRNELGEDVTVRSKAGYRQDFDGSDYCMVDAGVITNGEHEYIMCLMTGMNWSDDNGELMQDLVAALWDARGELGLQ